MSAVLCALALAATADAASSGGAQVIDTSGCLDAGGGAMLCTTIHNVFNTTTTPSGNVSVISSTQTTESLTGSAECNFEGRSHSSGHLLVKEGQDLAQESHNLFRAEDTITCFGSTRDCFLIQHFHFANGQVQFSRLEGGCTEV